MKPRILLVEDDPVTRAFLLAAVEALPATVDAVETLAAAHGRLQAEHYDLWLIDAHLPDGEGIDLLAQARAQGWSTPALAHTAAREADMHARLRDAGFVDVLVKPLATQFLHDTIGTVLRGVPRARQADAVEDMTHAGLAPRWDDAAALAALGGQRAHVDALRKLFLDELPDVRDVLHAAALAHDHAALHRSLHRLRASCGFVGAARVGAAVVALQAAPDSAPALADFLDAAQDALSSR